jgi:hypothetical protein
MFYVIEFVSDEEDNSVAVVPDNWLSEIINKRGTAKWPPYKVTSRVDKAVHNREQPASTWRQFSIRHLYGPSMQTLI